MTSLDPILSIENLTVAYYLHGEWQDAVRDVSLQIHPGQVYGLVGESGSGKTTLAMAIMRYLGVTGVIRSGKIIFSGRDIAAVSQADMREIWGAQISLVPQNPHSALNPSIRVGEQVAEILRIHLGMGQVAARQYTLELLHQVRLPDPKRVAESYPHQISGGMQQRVLIAMALSTKPQLLILDEPTTSLDVTTQAAILDLIRELIHGTTVLYVTHNLGVVAQICDRVAVMYAGELVEDAPLEELFNRPLHVYTQGLLESVPRLGETKLNARLKAIPGQIPSLGARPQGCVFMPRCWLADESCKERPPLFEFQPEHRTRCHHWQELIDVQAGAPRPTGVDHATLPLQNIPSSVDETAPPVLTLQDLRVHYAISHTLGEFVQRKPARQVEAVDGVSLEIAAARTLGLVGESGSGKSSLARAVVGLVERTDGQVELLQASLPARLSQRDIETLRQLQMVFQDPEEALNPHQTVGSTLRRPLITLLGLSAGEADSRIDQLLQAVKLPPEYKDRMPARLSGGEKQRVAIARAFASNPDLLIADEAVSSLDVSIQASIINLLNELQAGLGTTLLFISHDLGVVTYLSDSIAVVYLGRLMQIGPAGGLLEPPYHPYTEALIADIPIADPGARRAPIRLESETPSPLQKPTGCPFHTRCHRKIGVICQTQAPPWQETADGKRIYCHIPIEQLQAAQPPILKI
ncbi:MAG: oligopeptide/dipeptide transporter ATPase [Chloroflexi bacterium]|nr:oligopeptide/dipeptide transporter ATPase [Chloroflexota bacterium]